MFIASLPDIFFFNPFITAIEFGILLLLISILMYFLTPHAERGWQDTKADNIYTYLKLAWAGQIALWRVFWPFFMLVLVLLYYIDYRVNVLTFTISSWKTVHGMFVIPYLWWSGSVWRCSPNTRNRLAAVAARTCVVFLLFTCLFRLYLSVELADQLFDCKLLMLEYGDC